MTPPHSYTLNAIALLLFSSLVPIAEAAPPIQSIQFPDSGLLMRENRKPPEPPKKQSEVDIENTDQQRPPMQRQSDLQVTVQYFSFTGNTQFSNNELQALLTKYKGHPVSFDDLQAAADIISEHYRQAGYIVAHAYLPAQSIKHGIVEIVILEGHLDDSHLNGEAIEMIGTTRINKNVLQRFLNTAKTGDLITDADLGHLSLLINDLPGIESKAVLSPGKKTGTSSLGLKVKEGPLVSGYLASDNYGL
ncbi:MAG: POTRA domain-containing protein, partial [Methylococcales bacterium]